MPKVNKIQAAFTSGEVSKTVQGRVDIPQRYDEAMDFCQNYIPLLQGPLLRRGGTKYVTNVKDPSKPPALIPFQFSVTQNYMLEFGDKYIRFYANEGQIITTSNQFQIAGLFNLFGVNNGGNYVYQFNANRASALPHSGEILQTSSLVSAGSIFEVVSPYSWPDVHKIKFAQKQDSLYLTHPSYASFKVQRFGNTDWTVKPVTFQDGPYLPLNSYQSLGDSIAINLAPSNTGSNYITLTTSPNYQCSSIVANSAGGIRISTTTPHSFMAGDKVVVGGVVGTAEVNNVGTGNGGIFGSSTLVACSCWVVGAVGTNTLDLSNSTFTNVYVGSGVVGPALFLMNSTGSWADANQALSSMRSVGLIQHGIRYWGHIVRVGNAGTANVLLDPNVPLLTDSTVINTWQMGNYNLLNGFPAAVSFHQDRLTFGGHANIPQQIDASMSGNYELFSASGSNLQVADNNALQFSLLSQDLNSIKWIKSNAQGMILGTANAEWTVAPSNQSPGLTPTNISAQQVSFFGSYDADAVQSDQATIYIQRAQRKVRELIYFFQVGSFRSTNLTELSEHITLPSIVKLANQRETHPIVWGVRADGQMLSLSYSRDDVNIKSGWARHVLGGRSDSAGTPPVVKSIGCIPSSDTSYDELWMVVQRYINGTTVGTVEYMSKPFDDNTPQEQAYHFDCGVTFDAPINVTAIMNASSCVVTAPSHGFANSSTIRFYNTIGLNISTTDVNGNTKITNQLNENTFMIASASVNAFKIQDFLGNDINTNSSSVYVGSSVVRKLITSISGLTWLEGEQVSILADGGIHVNTSITQAGVLNLQYPAAIVQIGYQYNSDGQLLRTKDGSAQGTSIGSARRLNRVAFMLHNVGDLQFGPAFTNMIPVEFSRADSNTADKPPPLFDGVYRDGIESGVSEFTDTVCFRQNSGLPGMIQSITRFLEETDV